MERFRNLLRKIHRLKRIEKVDKKFLDETIREVDRLLKFSLPTGVRDRLIAIREHLMRDDLDLRGIFGVTSSLESFLESLDRRKKPRAA